MVGNEGEKSFVNLLSNYYGGTHEDNTATGVYIDTHLLSSTFSFLRSGYYARNVGFLYGRDSYGYYWLAHAYSHLIAYTLNYASNWLTYQHSDLKGYGFSLRCVAR